MPDFSLIAELSAVPYDVEWIKAQKFVSHERIVVDSQGRRCQLVAKQERALSVLEAIGRRLYGIFAWVASQCGFGWLSSSKITNLLTKSTQVRRFAILTSAHIPDGKQKLEDTIPDKTPDKIPDNIQDLKTPVYKTVKELRIPSGKITQGEGEYVLFSKDPVNTPVTKETFVEAYKIMHKYSPITLLNNGGDREKIAQRYQLICHEVKKINANLEVAFIPKALYELQLIRKCIQEDVKQKNHCRLQTRHVQHMVHYPERILEAVSERGQQVITETTNGLRQLAAEVEELQKTRKCWHRCYVDATNTTAQQKEAILEIAFRLNQACVKRLKPQVGGYTYQELIGYTEKEITFLKNHCGALSKEMFTDEDDAPGLTTNFGYKAPPRGKEEVIEAMGLRDENDAQIIRDTVALECSSIAQNSFLLYRGADITKDSVINKSATLKGEKLPFSLSYGSSLFAGVVYDAGATAFYYIRKLQKGYVIPLPFEKAMTSAVHVPAVDTLAQLFGDGEVFHARTKAPKNVSLMFLGGICHGDHRRDHLRSDFATLDALVNEFDKIKSQAIIIK